MTSTTPSATIIGRLREEYLITRDGHALPAHIGGPAAYAACGAAIWMSNVRIISRIWSSARQDWDQPLRKLGVQTSGVRSIQDLAIDPVFLYQHPDGSIIDHHPAVHYLKLGVNLPKALIEYQSARTGEDDTEVLSPAVIQPADLTDKEIQGSWVHLTPGHYLSHALLPYRAHELGAAFVSLSPSPLYMTPALREEVAALIQGLDAFLPEEASLQALFQRDHLNLTEMAEAVCDLGAKRIVINRRDGQKLLWDSASQRGWWIPSYPGEKTASIGAGEAFSGGFLAGMLATGDPIEAVLRGNISESLTVEGYGPLYASGSHPQLARLRLEALRGRVNRV
ncbi:MAG: carbohydrate kinase family protein [Anaerolineales bacterium]|nr:carbohydrate kinase family protein [Anaerolineales bacterium]